MTEFVSGSIFIRTMGEDGVSLKPGEKIVGHIHAFDHTSIFFNGWWWIKKWKPDGAPDLEFVREGPFFVLIDKDCRHEFTYLEKDNDQPGRAWCVYSHRTPQGEVSLTETGWMHAYESVG